MARDFKKIEEGAYFALDVSSFSLGVTPFDALLAGQTICYTWQELPEQCQTLPEQPDEEFKLTKGL